MHPHLLWKDGEPKRALGGVMGAPFVGALKFCPNLPWTHEAHAYTYSILGVDFGAYLPIVENLMHCVVIRWNVSLGRCGLKRRLRAWNDPANWFTVTIYLHDWGDSGTHEKDNKGAIRIEGQMRKNYNASEQKIWMRATISMVCSMRGLDLRHAVDCADVNHDVGQSGTLLSWKKWPVWGPCTKSR
jgi:hypothetical protein